MDKQFCVAGVSVLDGVMKARFANDMNRVKVLEKNGHTKVKLIELPELMFKEDAVSYLLDHDQFQDKAIQSTLRAYLEGAGYEVTEEPVAKPTGTKVREPRPSDKYETPVRPVGGAKAKAAAAKQKLEARKAANETKAPSTRGRRKVAVAQAEAPADAPAVSDNSEAGRRNSATIKKAMKTWQERRDTVGEQMLAESAAIIDAMGK